MPTSSPQAAEEMLRRKMLIPSELRSKEWSRVSGWVKERAFFMASVTQAELLQGFRDASARITSGELTGQAARQQMRDMLAAAGYQATPGLEGTIKDLSTTRRLQVSLDTNADLAAGWAQRERLAADPTRPGRELVRAGQAVKPRNWADRWEAAANAVQWQGVAKQGMIALADSPIWVALSAFGQPYPPFDYGSHMVLRAVDFDRCVELGLLTEEDGPRLWEEAEARPTPSLNEATELVPKVSEESLRRELAEQLQGLAEWDGDTLRMTDPNGTRPYGPDEIADIINAPLPAGFDNGQAEAWRQWAEDPTSYRDEPSLDRKEDMARLINRITPTSSADAEAAGEMPLSRALIAEEGMLDGMLASLRGGSYAPLPGSLGETWTTNPAALQHYAAGQDNIILRCVRYTSRRKVDGLYKAEGIPTKGESIMPGGVRYRVLPGESKRPNARGGYDYEFRVEEVEA